MSKHPKLDPLLIVDPAWLGDTPNLIMYYYDETGALRGCELFGDFHQFLSAYDSFTDVRSKWPRGEIIHDDGAP